MDVWDKGIVTYASAWGTPGVQLFNGRKVGQTRKNGRQETEKREQWRGRHGQTKVAQFEQPSPVHLNGKSPTGQGAARSRRSGMQWEGTPTTTMIMASGLKLSPSRLENRHHDVPHVATDQTVTTVSAVHHDVMLIQLRASIAERSSLIFI
jgi:hypothetical protein